MSKLWIVVQNSDLIAYTSLESLVETIPSLAEFIVNEPKLVCLTYKKEAKKDEAQWEIGDVALTEIAKAFIEREK